MYYRLVFFTLIIILISALNSNAQIPSEIDSVKIESSTSRPGEVVTTSIHLVNTFPVGGISTRLEYNQDVCSIQSVSLSSRVSFMNIFAVDTSNTGVLMLSAASLFPRTSYIAPGSGEVFDIEFVINGSAQPGSYDWDLRNSSAYNYENHLSDTTGLYMYLPVLADGELEIEPPVFLDYTDNKPENINILTNYPNPFNNHTVISFSLVDAGQARLVVYDLLGREVTSMVLGYKSPGSYAIRWDGRDNSNKEVSTGVYSYALYCNNYVVLTSKMILLR